MSQISFADAEQAGKRKKTRREVFLAEMELVVPWKALLELIEPHYPVAGRGRRPYPLQAMMRVHLMQKWFALSDPAMEEALYEIASLRTFAALGLETIPDEPIILNFRHLLEANDLAEDIFKQVNAHLARKGLLLKRGSIVDARIIEQHPGRRRRARDRAAAAHAPACRRACSAKRCTTCTGRGPSSCGSWTTEPGRWTPIRWRTRSGPSSSRRSWLFADTVGGANASANLYSLIETAKANNVEPYRYLVALFKKLPLAQTVDDYEALLPWNIELGGA